MESAGFDVVTGAFSYTGQYIARRLMSMGRTVRTITGHADNPDPFGGVVKAFPYNFDRPDDLARSLEGAATLYNTYWIRFAKGKLTHDMAVQNTRTLVRAAENAELQRIIHVSITNANPDSHLPYFRGKGLVEEAVKGSSLTHAIVRPTIIFGKEDILLNNIAWTLRRFPFFTMFGRGDYGVQPVFVEDMAELIVNVGQRGDNMTVDAVGPEVFTFEEMVRLMALKIGVKTRMLRVGPGMGMFLSRIVGYAVRDVTLTRDEIEGLMANLLVSNEPPTGRTRLSEWLDAHADELGRGYVSELERHYRRKG